ncbi:glycoside hydrolase family 26 protein [Melanomma pulvis-pyrius CBS 109.77]|uniref:Glycoside hydrolase family 26 protein n=1 Tax=Melanomma pulvis-pyrius CBS 109.77 TaxID=1314802 RepID=A0A6A6XK41_9PLEO|nr:glycoside hydrolase family 26 protein [Melanomma pulvis-pyrius CBS 109.77]
MRYALYLSALVASSIAISIPRTSPNVFSKRGIADLGLPADGLTTNCIAVGFLPSEGDSASPRYTMAQINSGLGAKSSAYGWYAQIRSSTFDGSQLLAVKDDIVASGAVFVASIMPSVNFNQITPEVAQQVAAVLKKFTDDGVEVWLRFAHEMNWYVVDGTYHGTSTDFITAWKNIYAANCKDNAHVKCFWSPNQAAAKDLTAWWPGPETVDIVGIDCYPRAGDDVSGNTLFTKFYQQFYDTYSAPYDIPFAIGETGAGDGMKEGWLKQLLNQDKSRYPNYVSMSWFEFDKEADFRIVMTDEATLKQTKDILLSGSGTCSKGGDTGNGTVTPPPATSVVATPPTSATPKPTSTPGTPEQGTCDWGCWGWDCSASVPCQDPWTCKGGYCK